MGIEEKKEAIVKVLLEKLYTWDCELCSGFNLETKKYECGICDPIRCEWILRRDAAESIAIDLLRVIGESE